jgi:hypothetical protein
MKKGSKFLIGFASATLTFASLVAFVGPPHTTRHAFGSGYSCHEHRACEAQQRSHSSDTIQQRNKK